MHALSRSPYDGDEREAQHRSKEESYQQSFAFFPCFFLSFLLYVDVTMFCEYQHILCQDTTYNKQNNTYSRAVCSVVHKPKVRPFFSPR